jgi:hypothetical protein
MIPVSRLAAQGDVLFRRIPELPARVIERRTDGPLVVAHSETGHHHVIDEPGVALFEDVERNSLICFLRVDGPSADVRHLRPYDTHETLRLCRGVWEVRRQREWSPEGWQPVLD